MGHSKTIDQELRLEAKLALTRCKSRGLVVPIRVGSHYYKFDMTELGLELLKEGDKPKDKPHNIKRSLPTFHNIYSFITI